MSESTNVPAQPKITHKLWVRTLILTLVLGSLYLGYQVWKDKSQDITALTPAATQGWIGAVKFMDNGQQAVAFGKDGKMVSCPGWSTGNTDRDLAWNPSGNRMFFVSDREENNFHVFRWNPTDGSDPVRRTIGSRSRGYPEFTREAGEGADESALITSGGFILEYRPKDMSTTQVLPPQGREMTTASEEEGGGSAGQFSGAYSHLGDSFKVAKWCKGKTWIASVMHRDQGEILVLQKMGLTADGKAPLPEPVAAGEHVDFDVNPKDGTIIFCVQNFQWVDDTHIDPRYIKNNKATKPYLHVVARIDPDDQQPPQPLAFSSDDKLCFGSPVISPDGSSVLLTAGPFENSTLSPKVLVTGPSTGRMDNGGAKLAEGEIYEPNWSPDGELIAFARREKNGKRSIFTIHKDGSSPVNLTGDTGNYGTPVFSPQTK